MSNELGNKFYLVLLVPNPQSPIPNPQSPTLRPSFQAKIPHDID
ncbi:hypothetical protein ACQFX9_02495 [Aliinostoc sp. HNIBRCY26]